MMNSLRIFTTGVLSLALVGAPVFPAIAVSDELRVRGADRDVLHEERTIRSSAASYRSDEILVKFKDAQKASRVTVPHGVSVEDFLGSFTHRGDVEYAEPNYIATAYAAPNDPYYSYQWHFDNASYGGIHMNNAWDVSQGAGVTVAIVDTGIAYEDYSIYLKAPDFSNTMFVPGYDFVSNDTHPNDENGHGTHVAGTVAEGTNNNSGVAGIAYQAALMPVRVLDGSGSGSYADVADGIMWAADNGAQVINLSLGGPTSSDTLRDAVAYAYNKGVTIVAASGNDNGVVGYPAAYDDYVIAVGATRFDEARAPYSNYGASLDIVAPGGDLNVDQNGDGYGDGVLQQTFSGSPRSFGYYFFQGTSMATPHVAGVAALVIANGNATSPVDVRTALQTTADDLGTAGRDDYFGHGLVNAPAALAYTSGGSGGDPTPNVNDPPVANAGPDVSVTDTDGNGLETVTLDGSASYDSDGSIVSYEWRTVSGTLLGTEALLTQSFSLGSSTITLTVTDNEGLSSSDSTDVMVSAVPPIVTIFSDSFEVSEWNGLWTEDSQNDWFRSSQRATQGSRSAEIDGTANNAALISQTIAMPQGKTTANISFDWYIESSLDSGEYVAMDVSVNGGSWTEKARILGNVDQENTWHAVNVQLSASSSVRIRFRGYMNSSNEDANVDNVVVIAQ
ncbi:MAG: serine protease [Parcubacteria group bacterium Gr01-1014_70]|nr:MAG: serine protease [Parcubacteria group bacterium Gr01-1014_70]